MQITQGTIRKTFEEGPMKAVVSVTIDDAFAIHEIKVIHASDKWFVVMPCRTLKDGTYRDIVHPINTDTRHALESAVLRAYFKRINNEED